LEVRQEARESEGDLPVLKRAALAGGAILSALLLLTWIQWKSFPAQGMEGVAPEPVLRQETLPPAVLRREDVEGSLTTPDDEVVIQPAPEAQNGMLRGLLLDQEGAPLADSAVSLIQDRHDGAGRSARWARSNADGYFEIEDIPPGTWSLRLARRGPRQTQAEWCWGEIQIHAGQTTWTDVSLAGTRTLTGRLLMAGEDGLGLALVLRAAEPPQQEIGETCVVMSEDLDLAEAGDEPNPAAARSGEFWFWGLAPARYELFIYLDVPRQRWVRRAVDLRHGDGDLGTEVLRWEDFLSETALSSPARPDAPQR
jgi:hypothetical protein